MLLCSTAMSYNAVCRSTEWTKISASDKQKLGLTADDESQFWLVLDLIVKFAIN